MTLNELNEDALVRILTEPKNAGQAIQASLRNGWGPIEVYPRGVESHRAKALAQKAGARGLRSILENAMLEIMYEIPSEESVREVIVNEEVMLRNEKPLILFQDENKSA